MSQFPHAASLSASEDRHGNRDPKAIVWVIISAVALAVSLFARYELWRWQGVLGFIRAGSEAALVGGLADWYAVTVLFRNPFERVWKDFPHTKIIPKQKERIADGLADYVQKNFLTKKALEPMLLELDVAAKLGDYLVNPAPTVGRVRDSAAFLVAEVLTALDPEEFGGPAKTLLKRKIEQIELAPLLGKLLEGMIVGGRHMPVLDSCIAHSAKILSDNKGNFQTLIRDRSNAFWRWVGVADGFATKLLEGIDEQLSDARYDKRHPLRQKIDHTLRKLARDLQHDPVVARRVAHFKEDALADPAFAAWLDGLWEQARTSLIKSLRAPEVPPGDLADSFVGLGRTLKRDEMMRNMINGFVRRLLTGLAVRNRASIVKIVPATVKRMNIEKFSKDIEHQIGPDLQWIRISGTFVGAFLGVFFHGLECFIQTSLTP